MSSKTTWGLVVAAAVLFALIFFVERPLREFRQRPISREVLHGLDPATANSVSIYPANQREIRAEFQSNSWQIVKPISYRADNQRIQAFLIYLSNIKWEGRILARDLKDRANALEEFGLVTPQYSIEIRDAQGARALRVGANSALGDKVFLQVGGSEIIYAASAELLRHIPATKDAWRDTELVRLNELAFDTVKARSGAKSFEIHRDAQGLWKLRAPLQARADSMKIDNLLSQLQSLRVNGFVADQSPSDLEPYGLQASAQTPQLELSLLRNTNALFSLQMGSSPTNHPELAYVRRRNPENILLTHREPLALWRASYTNFLDRHLISCPADQIDSIEVRGDDRFVLRRHENSWQAHVEAAGAFPADSDLMRFLLDTLTNAQTVVAQTVVAAFESYGLAQPSLTYILRGAVAQGQTNLIAQIEFGTSQDGCVFERRTDETSVNCLPTSYFGHLPRASWQLRDRRIWSFLSSNVVSVTVHQLGSTRKLIRDTDGEWTFAPGSHGMLNPFSLEETLYRLGELTAVYWDGVGDAGLEQFGFRDIDHQVILEVKTATGLETLKIEFGKRSPYLHPYASVIVEGQRRIFEFPVTNYIGHVDVDLTISPAARNSQP